MIPILYLCIGLVAVITMKQKVKLLEKGSYCFCSCYLCQNVSAETPKNLTTKLFALLNPELLNKRDKTKLKWCKASFRFSSCIWDACDPKPRKLHWNKQRQFTIERCWPFSKVTGSFICFLNYSSPSFMINKLQSSCLHWITDSLLTFLFLILWYKCRVQGLWKHLVASYAKINQVGLYNHGHSIPKFVMNSHTVSRL